MTTVSGGDMAAATPDLPSWAETLLAVNDATGVVEWLPFLLFAAGILGLAYATRTRPTETLNERNTREVEEGWR